MNYEPKRSLSLHFRSIRRAFALLLFIAFAFETIVVEKTRSYPSSGAISTALDPLIYKYPPQTQATLVAIGKGIDEFAAGRFAAALATLPSGAAAGATAVADYDAVYRAKACLELGRGKEALDGFIAAQARYPDSSLAVQCRLGQARALLLLSDPAGAIALLERMPESADVLELKAQALQAQGKTAEAAALHLRIFSDYAVSAQADAAEKRLRLLSPSFLTRTENRDSVLKRAENLLRAGRNSDARQLLLRVAAVPGPQAARLSLLIADADTNLKLNGEALSYLTRISEPEYGAQVTYLQGVCYRGLRNEPAFLAARDRALQAYPDSPYTEKLLYSVATYFDVDDRTSEARDAYRALATAFPKGEYVERALWKVAMFLYLERRYSEALATFWECLRANPKPGAAIAPAYWMGRCLEKLGDTENAVYLYAKVQALANQSYYGQRAREAAEAANALISTPIDPSVFDFGKTAQLINAIHPAVVVFPEPGESTRLVIERARQLSAAGLLGLALNELEHGYTDSGAKDKALCYAISRVYQARNDSLGAIVALRRAFPEYVDLPASTLPEEVWSILFPVRHFTVVSQHANRYGIDPSLVLGIIRQESAFQESARSKADARGLMQVLPSTGRILARQIGIQRFTASKLYTPETNVALGTRYLSSLLQRYAGRVELALAAYNAGENRVDRWLLEFGNVDMPEFVERIPFSETRGYVKTVMSNRAHYVLRTSNSGLANTLRKE